MLRFLCRHCRFCEKVNGYTPFFQALFKANLAIIVGGLSRSEWVGMLRFRHPHIIILSGHSIMPI